MAPVPPIRGRQEIGSNDWFFRNFAKKEVNQNAKRNKDQSTKTHPIFFSNFQVVKNHLGSKRTTWKQTRAASDPCLRLGLCRSRPPPTAAARHWAPRGPWVPSTKSERGFPVFFFFFGKKKRYPGLRFLSLKYKYIYMLMLDDFCWGSLSYYGWDLWKILWDVVGKCSWICLVLLCILWVEILVNAQNCWYLVRLFSLPL